MLGIHPESLRNMCQLWPLNKLASLNVETSVLVSRQVMQGSMSLQRIEGFRGAANDLADAVKCETHAPGRRSGSDPCTQDFLVACSTIIRLGFFLEPFSRSRRSWL